MKSKELNIPNKIYLQWYGDGDPVDGGPNFMDDVTWYYDKINEQDITYVLLDSIRFCTAPGCDRGITLKNGTCKVEPCKTCNGRGFVCQS